MCVQYWKKEENKASNKSNNFKITNCCLISCINYYALSVTVIFKLKRSLGEQTNEREKKERERGKTPTVDQSPHYPR